MSARRHLVLLLSLFLVGAPSASAHIDIQPVATAPGATESFRLSVPNERQTDATVAIALRLPAGFTDVRADAEEPWTVDVTTDGDLQIIKWSGGQIRGSDTATFRFTARTPTTPNVTLTLPATQTYSHGEVDRWIEDTAGEFAAPVLTLGSGSETPNAPGDGGRGPWLIVATIAAVVAAGAILVGRRPRGPDS